MSVRTVAKPLGVVGMQIRLGPFDGSLGDVIEECDVGQFDGGVIMVAGQSRDIFITQEFNAFIGLRAVTHHVAQTDHVLHAEFLDGVDDRAKGVRISVDVGEDGDLTW